MKLLFLAMFLSQSLNASELLTYKPLKENNEVRFLASAVPGFLRINAVGGHLDGSLTDDNNKLSGILTVPLKDFDTGIDLRSEHMRNKYLLVDKFPEAKLVLMDQPYKSIEEFKWVGSLTIKNDTHKVEGLARVIPFSKDKKVFASFDFDLTDFPSIGAPCYFAVCLAKKVSVYVEAIFK